MTHNGAQFIREELQIYNMTEEEVRLNPVGDTGICPTAHTFVPLCAGSPVFGGSHHIIINYADKFASKSFQPQLLRHLRSESRSPLRRRMRRELGFQEMRTYGIIWGREYVRKHASVQAEIRSRVEIQLGYDLYWERLFEKSS